jgi:2-polyprenyl-3-methyl-5-hydroxy-6-metoxy-1,4-benzoquinol methylase
MKKDLIEELYANKEMNYFSLERALFKEAVTENNLNILDVGCGAGILGAHYIKNQNCKVYGVEISKSAFEQASELLTKTFKGNIESMVFEFQQDFFDVIIMGDVVEHLINPIETIKNLMPYLKQGGKIHITVPNVKHWTVVYALVFKDEWEYKDWGILDYTHLKFFTKKSFVNSIKNLEKVNVLSTKRVIQKPSKSYLINKFTFGLFSGFIASHTFVTINKI